MNSTTRDIATNVTLLAAALLAVNLIAIVPAWQRTKDYLEI